LLSPRHPHDKVIVDTDLVVFDACMSLRAGGKAKKQSNNCYINELKTTGTESPQAGASSGSTTTYYRFGPGALSSTTPDQQKIAKMRIRQAIARRENRRSTFMQQFDHALNRSTIAHTETFASMRLYVILLITLTSGFSWAYANPQQPVTANSLSDPVERSKFELVVANQKKNDAAVDLFERIERVESKKTTGDAPLDVKISRVVPAGTGVAHIPVGAEGTPTDPVAYRAALEKLVNSLDFATADGRAQHDAYEKIAKKHKDRDELIDATRNAFIFTFIGREPRGDRMLSKYSMIPNPAFHATSRSTAIFARVRGFVWIDDESNQLARIEGEVTDDISVGLFLAKVSKGSHFMQERYEFAPGLWFPSFSQYDFDGRKFFTTFSFHERTFYSKYHRIGPPK
jgi:hypothetical protein